MRRVWSHFVFTIGAALAAGCQPAFPEVPSCGEIPAGGCPDQGQGCSDPYCASVYRCEANGWRLRQVCSADGAVVHLDGSLPVDGGYDPTEAQCPTLEEPDCPRSRALSCTLGCCGCEDVFACVQGNWSLVASCTDAGLAWSK